MAKSVLSENRFHSEEAAFDYVEKQLWPKGAVCPHCGENERVNRLQGVRSKPSKKHPEGVAQPGLWKCYAPACRKQFTVRVGTIFEGSHLGLHLWLQAIHLLCASKKGISTRQLQRMLGCGMKTAWHLGHRIRFAMAPADDAGPLGGPGKTVEGDETALTNSRKTKRGPGRKKPHALVLSFAERGGDVRSVTLDHNGVTKHLRRMVHRDSRLVTDKARHYALPPVADHDSVDHSKFEWARGDVHTNTLEGFFSVVKRGLFGVYQHVEKRHLDRYLAEFDFRQNTRAKLGIDDTERARLAIRGTIGKRLTYMDSSMARE